ncbi:MAG TPA: CRISPR-associated helicase Cas3' [Clostridiales bacterium]|nr:CRISPR-associated helicase Cas3' [Clostridiales bacterium]
MLNNILAKKNPDETLVNHTEAVLQSWQELKERYQSTIGFSEEFWQNSYLAALLHDTGKALDNFQEMLKDGNYEENIRHEFISGIILFLTSSKYYQANPAVVWAVFSHHKKLNDELFTDISHKEIKINAEIFKAWFEYLNAKMKNDFTQRESILKLLFKIEIKQNLYNTNILLTFTKNTIATRKEYIFHKALLCAADWQGSSHQPFAPLLKYRQVDLQVAVSSKLLTEKKIENNACFQFRQFQLKSNIDKNVLAEAPTGSGKTEAALIWASQKEDMAKIVYLLPTRVTTNAIYQRLCRYFGDNNVALVHSSALYFQKERKGNDYSYFDFLRDKTFFKNISVCTIDQVLTMGFNLGYWELKTFHLFKAKVIIDEIHLYEPYTLGLIVATIKYLKEEFQTTFFIMTATMPDKLKELIIDTIGRDQLEQIADKELLLLARNSFEVRDSQIDDLDDEIRIVLNEDRKVLIVVNTVDEAIRLYHKYVDFKPVCYHGRFINKDKLEIENIVTGKTEDQEECRFLIATQIVEVSLDIDYDILFSENAPIDAIIQRAGRVNRTRKNENTKVIVFRHTEVAERFVYPKDILENTYALLEENNGKRLTEQELTSLVNQVYKNTDIVNNEEYQKALSLYKEIQKQNHFIKDVSGTDGIYTREGMDSVSIIPMRFQPELVNSPQYEKAKYEVSIRKQRYGQFRHEKDKDGFIYLDVHYDDKIGVDFKKKESIKIF